MSNLDTRWETGRRKGMPPKGRDLSRDTVTWAVGEYPPDCRVLRRAVYYMFFSMVLCAVHSAHNFFYLGELI